MRQVEQETTGAAIRFRHHQNKACGLSASFSSHDTNIAGGLQRADSLRCLTSETHMIMFIRPFQASQSCLEEAERHKRAHPSASREPAGLYFHRWAVTVSSIWSATAGSWTIAAVIKVTMITAYRPHHPWSTGQASAQQGIPPPGAHPRRKRCGSLHCG